jgi:hypothetical protein
LALLADAATPVHAQLLAKVRETLWARHPVDEACSDARIAASVRRGFATLAARGFAEGAAGEGLVDLVERCRRLADSDPRFRFIYRLPGSVGWGVAIGDTMSQALGCAGAEVACAVTGLMNAFMTLLDGLLDETPEIIAPHRAALAALVVDGLSGATDIRSAPSPTDHPFNQLSFEVARLWLSQCADPRRPKALSAALAGAVREAMRAEYESADAGFNSAAPNLAALYGRTRWPLYAQTLATVRDGADLSGHELTILHRAIFRIADFAAWLDDVRDYVDDCRAERWNTVSSALFRSRGFDRASVDDTAALLLTPLAEDGFATMLIDSGCAMRARIDEALEAASFDVAGMRALVADVTYDYLHA